MASTDPLLTMVVGGVVTAFALGFVAHKLRLPPVVGYLLAGVLIGPHTPGFAADPDLAAELAELGVILIMFGMGLKFSPRKLYEARALALPGALGQMAAATALGYGVGSLLGLKTAEALIFGVCLSIASTIVVLRALESRKGAMLPIDNMAVGWLIVQDLMAVFIIVIMPVIAQKGEGAGGAAILQAVGVKALELGLFMLIMVIVGRRILPPLLVFIARAKSRELFSLGVFALALGIAFAAHGVFGTTFALGAFVAGLVLSESEMSHRAGEDLTPLRDAFAVLFFVSVGMLFDVGVLMSQPWSELAVLAVIILGNGGAVFLMTSALRLPVPQRLKLAGGLAQIGEFSFLISGFGLTLGLVSEQTHALIVAGALIAIAANPLVSKIAELAAHRASAEEPAPAAGSA